MKVKASKKKKSKKGKKGSKKGPVRMMSMTVTPARRDSLMLTPKGGKKDTLVSPMTITKNSPLLGKVAGLGKVTAQENEDSIDLKTG